MKKTFALISILVTGLYSGNTLAATATIGPCQKASCVDYFQKYKKYARIGYSDAMVTLAEMYYYGHGTEMNKKKALKQFKDAAKYGSVKGQHKTAMMYLNNEEFKDIDKGIKYLKKAARNNSTGSSFLLGIMYFDKDFYEQDFQEADKWLSKAYKGGFKKMLPYIELIKKSDHFNKSNLPNLIDAMNESPLVIDEKPSVTIAKITPTTSVSTKSVSTKSVPTKSESVAKNSAQEVGNSPKSNIEVITVYSNLNEILDSQLLSFRYALPEKGAQSTGSRVIGKTCAQTMSCAPTSQADFERGVRLVMGDQAVAQFSESFRGYAGF
jgi:hypothetical protein